MANVEHLKLIQAAISRMAANSFLIKAWTVTLVAALSAVAKAEVESVFAWIAAGVVVVFALLDAFYLALERAYRVLYKRAAREDPTLEPWTLEAGNVRPRQVLDGLTAFAIGPLYAIAFGASILLALTT